MSERTFRVWRGDAGGGDFAEFDVEVNEGEVVLDVVHRIQAEQAPDLAVRWNCKAGKCGSCSAEVNGMPRLMCMTRMNLFEEGETVTVTPLRTFPVVRDLVTDVSFNYEKAREMPAFAPPSALKRSSAPSRLTSTSLTVVMSGTTTESTSAGAPALARDQIFSAFPTVPFREKAPQVPV